MLRIRHVSAMYFPRDSVFVLVSAIAFLRGICSPSWAEDSLEDLREEVRQSSTSTTLQPSSSKQYRQPNNVCDEDECYDDGWGDLLKPASYALGIVATSPFWGPAVLVGDDRVTPGYFPRHPYRYRSGYMRICEDGGKPLDWLSVRASGEYGTNFRRMDWVAGRLLIETTSRWGTDSEVRWLNESLPSGRSDSLWLGDTNILYRFAQGEKFQARAGMGLNYLADNVDTNLGVNFTYSADWYPTKPAVVSSELDLGWLGQETLFHFRITQGINWRSAEAFLGYDYYAVGSFQVGGMVAGVRLWF